MNERYELSNVFKLKHHAEEWNPVPEAGTGRKLTLLDVQVTVYPDRVRLYKGYKDQSGSGWYQSGHIEVPNFGPNSLPEMIEFIGCLPKEIHAEVHMMVARCAAMAQHIQINQEK